MSSAEEAQALGRSEFWDERYAKADGDKPTHEWFRGFSALEPFFTKYLFASRKAEAQPRILHLGSGDSVSVCFYLWGLSFLAMLFLISHYWESFFIHCSFLLFKSPTPFCPHSSGSCISDNLSAQLLQVSLIELTQYSLVFRLSCISLQTNLTYA